MYKLPLFLMTIMVSSMMLVGTALAAETKGGQEKNTEQQEQTTNNTPKLGGWTVAPPIIQNVQVKPGQTMTGVLQLFPGGPDKDFEVSIGTVRQDQHGGYLFTPPSKDPREPSTWLTASPERFTSGPGDVEPINWTLKVPENAEPGDHLGVIYVTQKTRRDANASGTLFHGRIAVRMEITVAGELNFHPVIDEINVPLVSSKKNVPLSVRLKNEGNVRMDLNNAEAYLEVQNKDKTVARYRMKGMIFPGSERLYRFTWKDAPALATPTAKVVIDWKNDKRENLTASQRFFLGPWRLILAVLLGTLALVAVGIYFVIDRRRRARNEEVENDLDEEVEPTADADDI